MPYSVICIATVPIIYSVGCGPPPPPPRGSLGDLTSSQQGAVVTFQCNPGLVPSQQMMSVCAADGSWTPDPAEQTCMQPPPVKISVGPRMLLTS